MVAWSIALGRAIFGDVPFAILADLARRLYGEAASLWAVLLYLIQPVMFFTAGSGFPDSPVLFFWAAAMSLVFRALETGEGWWWIPAGLALGLGMISKYTIVFLVASVLLHLLSSPRDRRWLATPWPYPAAAVAIAAFTPVLWWNARHDWASIRFQGQERFGSANEFLVKAFLKYVGLQWGAVVPLTLPLALVAIGRSARSDRPGERFLFWCFAPMMAFFMAVSWTMPTHVLWPLPCWLGVPVATAGLMVEERGRVGALYRRAAPWLAGVTAALFLAASVHAAFLLPRIPQPSPMHGWAAVAMRTAELRAELPKGAFVLGLGRRYFMAAELAIHLRAPLGQSDLQVDFWTDPKTLKGCDAAVVVEKGYEVAAERQLARIFRSVVPAGTLTVPLRGRKPLEFLLYRERDYVPQLLTPPRRQVRVRGLDGTDDETYDCEPDPIVGLRFSSDDESLECRCSHGLDGRPIGHGRVRFDVRRGGRRDGNGLGIGTRFGPRSAAERDGSSAGPLGGHSQGQRAPGANAGGGIHSLRSPCRSVGTRALARSGGKVVSPRGGATRSPGWISDSFRGHWV